MARFPINDSTPDSAVGWFAEHFKMIAESVDEGIVVQSSDGIVTWNNTQAERILGLTQEQLRGHTPVEVNWHCVHEDGRDLPGVDHPAMIALRTGQPQLGIVMGVRRPDETMTWLLASSNPLTGGCGVVTSFFDITARMSKERMLEALHARESAILDGAQVAIIGTDLSGLIHTFNLAASRMLGWSSEEVLGKLTLDQLHDSLEVARYASDLGMKPGFDVLVHEALSGRTKTSEWTYLRKDGGRIPVSLTVSPIRDPQGGVVGYMGVAEDVTERQHFMDELQKLALVASRTHNVVIVTDAQARAEWVNDAFARVTGFRPDEVKGRRVGSMVQGPDTDPAAIAKMRDAIKKGEGFQVEILNYGKTGRRYWLEIDCQPFHATDGKLLGFIAVEAEITARKRIEDQLRESEARLRAFVEALPDLAFRVSRDGVFLDAHAPNEQLFLLPREKFIGQRVVDVLPAHIASTFVAASERALRTNTPQSYEFELELGEGTRDFEARVVPGLGSDVLVIVRDVSERKLLDLMKDEFVATVSHELRTPLTAIQGTLGLLSAGVLGELGAEAQELVSAALSNSARLGRLINDILDLEKVTRDGFAMQRIEQPLAPLVERAVLESAAFATEYHVTYLIPEVDQTLRVSIDTDRFIQVLHNLLSNAAKYGNSYDVVTVGFERNDDGVRIYVRNRGAPIPESFRRRIFGRFAVVDGSDMRAQRGTGLGLAITKSLVGRMGGQIDYVSSAEYTEFAVVFPIAQVQ